MSQPREKLGLSPPVPVVRWSRQQGWEAAVTFKNQPQRVPSSSVAPEGTHRAKLLAGFSCQTGGEEAAPLARVLLDLRGSAGPGTTEVLSWATHRHFCVHKALSSSLCHGG